MSRFEELKVAIDALERASEVIGNNEAMTLLEIISNYCQRKYRHLTEDEQELIERRLDDAEFLIRARNVTSEEHSPE